MRNKILLTVAATLLLLAMLRTVSVRWTKMWRRNRLLEVTPILQRKGVV